MTNDAVLSCPEPCAVPIVFIPGIMGSRLRQGTNGPIVFDPDVLGNVRTLATSDGAEKRLSLVGPSGTGFSPDHLTVHRGAVGDDLTQEQFDRGWGGVLQSFYRGFLIWLQNTAQQPASSDLPLGCFNLNYEAWAHPYNWTNDNRDAGRDLDAVVNAAISGTEEKYAGRDVRVLKPIIVTHSKNVIIERVGAAVAASGRPKFTQLLRKLDSRSGLIVWRLDELGRNAADILKTIQKVQERGVDLYLI